MLQRKIKPPSTREWSKISQDLQMKVITLYLSKSQGEQTLNSHSKGEQVVEVNSICPCPPGPVEAVTFPTSMSSWGSGYDILTKAWVGGTVPLHFPPGQVKSTHCLQSISELVNQYLPINVCSFISSHKPFIKCVLLEHSLSLPGIDSRRLLMKEHRL